MFSSGYAESSQGSVSIRDVSKVAMATILDYAYTGCLKTEPDQVQAVMSAARLLQVDFVSQKAAEYMKAHLDVSNCTDVLMYADMISDLTLQEASGRYMASRFNQVTLQPSFVQLSLPQLQSVLNRDDLLTTSEDDVVQAVLRWINFDQEQRQQHLPVLCRSLRHSFISSKHLAELQSKCMSAECKLTYSDSTTKRHGQVRSEALIFLKDWKEADDNLPNVNATPCYDPCKGKLYKMNIPENLHAPSMVGTTDGELYLTGGTCTKVTAPYSRTVPQKGFYQYNHLLDSWEPRCEMISARVRCGLVYLKGYIYAIGGDETKVAVERYDTSCDEWTSLAPIPYAVSSELCAVVLDDSIYVISKEGCCYFSPKDNSWGKTTDMRTPLVSPQAVTYKGHIFCLNIGTYRNPGPHISLQIYNPGKGVWRCVSGDIVSVEYYQPILMLYDGSLLLLLVRHNGCPIKVWHLPRIYLYQYQAESYSWLRVKDPAMAGKVPPMLDWVGGFGRTDCLTARMIPVCMDNAANAFRYKDGEYSEEYESDDDVEGDNSNSINIFDSPMHEVPEYSDSEDDMSDQEGSDVENSDDEENETDNDDDI